MEINLVKDVSLTFKNDRENSFCTLQAAVPTVSITVNQVTGSHTQQKLQSRLNSILNGGITAESEISCAISMGKVKNTTEKRFEVIWATNENNSFFQKLSQLETPARFQMTMEILDTKVSAVGSTKNISHNGTYIIIQFNFLNKNDDWAKQWRNQNGETGTISGKFTLDLILDDSFLSSYFHDNSPTNPCLLALAKMLENERECDTVITSASGTTVKCNRAFLVASCPYFEAMFQSEMQEAHANQIDMTDLSEAEIRAFLGFLYKGDVKPALEDTQTAWTLLKAGNYYQLDNLFEVMREILMVRKHEKYNIDLALDMLLFAKSISGNSGLTTAKDANEPLKNVWNDVTLKAVLVLKWYSKERPLELMASEKYNKLYKETPQLAMKLHATFLQYLDEDEFEKRLDGAANFMD